MAQVHGVAGEWARVRGTVFGLLPLFISIGLAGFSLGMTLFYSFALGGTALVVSLTAMAYTLYRGEHRMESYFKGARGEERVAGLLKALPDEYHVFNDFVAGKKHVDHVVVGPAGVFAVETKFWRGKVTVEDGHVLVDGQLPTRDPVLQVLGEADRLKAALQKAGWVGPVTPLLCFASNTFEAKIAEEHGVLILNARELVRSFAVDRVIIPSAELERLVRLMESRS